MPLHETQTEVQTKQTVQFYDQDAGETVEFKDAGTEGVYESIAPSIELGEFLRRPTRIATYAWTSAWTDQTLYPWKEFLTATPIANKLQNFPYLRGKLKLKYVINCSPFFYGAMRAVYQPLYGNTGTRVATSGTPGSPLIPYSQFPGVWIYPQTNSGGEMELPFFYHRDYVPLASASTLQFMGRVIMTDFVPLASANGTSTSGCTITVYAWMEDVHLAGMTSQLILQSDEYDEASGVVSRPAAILSNWAQYLEKAPVIGRFATATKIGMNAVSKIATLFGWTNVPIVSSVMPFKNLPFHDLASAEISQPVVKFTLDPKAEISVAPYMVGLSGEDELAISNFIHRDSYLTSFSWATTDAPDKLFFSSVVNPLLYDRGTADANNTLAINMTPMCLVARMFRFWRGDIIFTFRIIASKFHKGRFRIHWEPYGVPSSTNDISNTTLTKVVDVDSNMDVEFRVPYMQTIPWLEHMHQGDVYTTNRWSTGAVKTPSKDDDNGSLVVRCVNNLSAPVDSAAITVMVFVRGAENMQFANPIDITQRFSYLVPQAGDEFEDISPDDENLYLKNWGEPILSLRKLMRRSQLVDIRPMFLTASATHRLYEERLVQSKYPPMPGYTSTAFDQAQKISTASPYGFNFTQMTYFAWVAPCFLGLRGSMRWHYNVISDRSNGPNSIAVYRDPGVTGAAQSTVILVSSSATGPSTVAGAVFNTLVNYGSSGVALTNAETQTGLSVEMPYMIPFKFVLNDFSQWAFGQSADKSNADLYKVIVRRVPTSIVSNTDFLERYASIGTDFNAHFFLSVPTLYYNPSTGSIPV